MAAERLRILCLSHLPPSPPRFGAQARLHGLWTHLARRHDLTAVALVDEEFDLEECRRAMRAYCREVELVPNPRGRGGMAKRLLQLRSLPTLESFERYRLGVPRLREALDGLLLRERFDVVNLEFPYLAHLPLRRSPPGAPPPPLVIDTHEIAHDLARQLARGDASWSRRAYGALNSWKLRREELAAFRAADGICACSAVDQARLLADVPGARTAVVPNAADVERLQPRPSDPPSDGRTVLFFGLMSTVPNVDGVLFLAREIWPRIAARCPEARLKIVGARPPPAVRELAGPRVEVAGLVDDLRPHLAQAAAVVVPLRLGGGTRLKIVEGMAMGKAIVSTTLGAEGIEAVPDREILLADDPEAFAAAVARLLESPALAERMGRAARELAVRRYSWSAAAETLEDFWRQILEARRAPA
ncbi:MAG TPA: glycosyltransferase family 4 protein [Anaeromyxobacteraceae bacterium]|jgi:glycosyltransferase involved in cell wall biosynthesis